MVLGLIFGLATFVVRFLLFIIKFIIALPMFIVKLVTIKLPFYFLRTLPGRVFCLVSTTIKLALVAVVLALAAHNFEKLAAIVCPNPAKSTVFPFEEQQWTVKAPSGNTAIEPFSVAVPDNVLEDLQKRLSNTRYASSLNDVNFEYGFPPEQLKKVVEYWQKKYNWRKQEAVLNQYPQFKTEIEGLNIHFAQIKPKVSSNVRVLPIILLHGFPGSYFELYKLVPLLTASQTFKTNYSSHPQLNIAFEVIIPSLPGYGFSDAPEVTGMDTGHMARIMHTLMVRLGHSGYVVQGGDWGAMIARAMAVMYPRNVKGLELTMYNIPFGANAAKGLLGLVAEKFATNPLAQKVIDSRDTHKILWKNLGYWLKFTGYFHFQATKPDTVGSAVTDSPAGMAAYILDLFAAVSDPDYATKADGALAAHFSMDELLTNVMICWVSGSFTSAARLYKEDIMAATMEKRAAFAVTVPTVLSDFPNEPRGGNAPEAFVRPYFKNLVEFRRHDKCGHFAALECPKELAEDIWALIPHFAAKPLAKDKPVKKDL